MRIGLYGMPASGKTFILNKIDFIDVAKGSSLLYEANPNFEITDEFNRKKAREKLAKEMKKKDCFIMDGHYAFGDNIVFTEEDGKLYDVFLYLYISPNLLEERMRLSEKNNKYLNYDLNKWQQMEINSLREYCHNNYKDFYVLDNPPSNYFEDVSSILNFIHEIINGYSCQRYAFECAKDMLSKSASDTITLIDGDKTLTIEDSSKSCFNYSTHIYDGNFYTGYQAWKQDNDFQKIYLDNIKELPVQINNKIVEVLKKDTFIVTSGHWQVWNYISNYLGMNYYNGKEMASETKLFITKYLQQEGKKVIAYGDSMNDYYMLRQANKGFIVAKQDGSVSQSLKGRDLEGISIV
jgi:hypothetical protein